jgi:tetratricopeptide (TPR) repeat protein
MSAKKKHLIILIFLMSVALTLSSCAGNPEKAKAKYLASGQKYMKKGQYASAAIEYRNALKLDPRFVDAYYQLAQADLAQRDWSSGYAALGKVIELDPNRLDARLDRGRLYFAARDFEGVSGGGFKKAEEEASFVISQDPKNVGAYQLLGAALISEQKPDQALTAFSKAAELTPTDASTYVNMALAEITLHRLPEAEQHLRQAIQVDPKSVQANIDLANFYRLESKLPEALQVLQVATQNSPDAVPLYIDWANMLSSAGKIEDADGVMARLRTQLPKSAEAAISIGDYYVQRNNSEKALEEYRRGLSISANNLDIERRMEDLYLASNQTEQAAQIDSRIMKQAPKDVLARVAHGRLLMAQDKKQDALKYFLGLVKDAADSPQVHYYLALSQWQNGNLGDVNRELEETLRLSPGLSMALRSLAQLHLSLGNLSVAQAYAQQLVQKFPSNVSDRLLLGGVFLREGQNRNAEEQFQAALRLAPKQAAVHLDLGQLYSLQKKWPEAEKELETAVQLDPSNTTILSQYADFLAAHQQAPKAVARAQQFVDTNPNNAQGYMILGALHFQAKNNTAAQAEFERAIQLNPKDVQAYLRVARIFETENQTEAAIGEYQKALELQPKFAALCAMIGNLYLDKDLETARKYYQKALDVDPNFAVALANMAWVDALEGKDLDVALGMAQKAKSQKPELPSITDTLAWVMYKKGNYSGAIPLLEEAVKKAPSSAEYHYHLGMSLVAAGQKEKGKGQLQAALQMKQLKATDAEQARQALAQAN